MDIKGYRIRLYVGPCGVKEIAEKIRAAGFTVDIEGTEHIHYRAPFVDDGWGTISACDAVAKETGLTSIGNLSFYTVISTY